MTPNHISAHHTVAHRVAHHGQHTAASDSYVPLVIFWAVVIFCALLWWWLSKNKRSADEQRAVTVTQQNREDFIAALRGFYAKPLEPVTAPIELAADEKCYFAAPAQQYSVHSQRRYAGSYGGPSFRIARGVYYRVGTSGGRSQSVEGMASDGDGNLYITNKRIVFVGEFKTVQILFTKIADVAPFVDGFHVDVLNAKPMNYETGDQMAYLVYSRIRSGLFAALTADAVEQVIASTQKQAAPT